MFDISETIKRNGAMAAVARKDEIVLEILKAVFGKPLCDLAMEELKGRLRIERQSNGVESFFVDGKEVLRTGCPVFSEELGNCMMSIRLKIDIPLWAPKQ